MFSFVKGGSAVKSTSKFAPFDRILAVARRCALALNSAWSSAMGMVETTGASAARTASWGPTLSHLFPCAALGRQQMTFCGSMQLRGCEATHAAWSSK